MRIGDWSSDVCSSYLVDEQSLEMRVADREAARQRLVGIDIRRDRLDARAGAAADDADRRGRRDRHLAAEALHHALIVGISSDERRVGKMWVSRCRSRGASDRKKKTQETDKMQQ